MVPYHYTTRREWLEDCNIRSSNQLPGQVELLKKGKDRLFVVGPLPPSKSGVATYSIQLARELVRWFEVILVCDTIPTLETEFRHLSPEEFVKERQSNEAVLYHFGNSPFHHFIDSLLEIIPGVVILHDVCLRDLQLWREQGNLHSPRLIKILRQEAEPSPLRCFPTSGEDIGDLNFAPVLLSSHLIVHSKEALRRVLASNENIKKEHISVVPLSRDKEIMGTADGSTAHLGIESDEFVIASFGIISKTKMSMEIVESIGAHFSRHPMLQKVHLIFVGEPHDSQYKSDLEEAFKTLPNKIKVSITGWVSDESYLWHLKRADLCIQLRTQSRGESSAALLDCLTLGKALVISDIPENSEIPEQVVFKISNNSLTQNLGDVLSRSGEYKARGELAKIYADENLSLAANAEVYAKILLGASNDLESLEKRSQRLGGYKNLYVDVSAIHLQDLGTGIQRVVHKTLHYLLRNKSNKFRIVPVFFEAAQNKFMTSETILTKSMDWSTTVFSPSQIRPEKGDIFLGLDLSFTNIYEGELSRFHESEVQIYFVIYDLLPVLHPEFFPSEAVDSFKGWLSMTSKYDGVICISKNTLSDYVAHFPYLPKYFAKGVFPLGSDFDSVPRDFTARETSAARGRRFLPHGGNDRTKKRSPTSPRRIRIPVGRGIFRQIDNTW
jgi:glycosyltransferase involved in cell wall biosynthesis